MQIQTQTQPCLHVSIPLPMSQPHSQMGKVVLNEMSDGMMQAVFGIIIFFIISITKKTKTIIRIETSQTQRSSYETKTADKLSLKFE